jgi:nucleoside 2-deoxyribosyltransferase
MKTVYLAGPITGLTYDDGQDWRLQAIEWLQAYGIAGRSPLRCKEFLKSIGTITDHRTLEIANPLSMDAGIITRDRNDVMTCDAVLMNLSGAKGVSIGTMIEVGWADAFRKPLIVVMENSGSCHEHAMVRCAAGYRVTDLKAGLAICATVLGENNVRA